jgi:anthranilate phosphoribosyltransferase
MIKEILERVSSKEDLHQNEAHEVMGAIMDGQCTPAQIAGLLVALKMKGESVEEITGFVCAMREKATRICGQPDLVDTCGTGGDGSHTFNISTAAAIVAAAAGVPVAKHGNRSVSSKCGSADVLQELGVKIDLTPAQAEACLKEIGLAFLFAPTFHASMKHAVVPRREMGIRTIFNILGPMSNPAGANRQVIGAFDLNTADKMVQVMQKLESRHVLVVHSEDGLDEISISAPTQVHELWDGNITHYKICPEDLGLRRHHLDAIQGSDPAGNAVAIRNIFDSGDGPRSEITALNAGAAIYVAGKSKSLKEGVQVALETLKSGKAKRKLNELIDYTTHCTTN